MVLLKGKFQQSKLKGFTIIEMILVMLLFSIVFGLVYNGIILVHKILFNQQSKFTEETSFVMWSNQINSEIFMSDSVQILDNHFIVFKDGLIKSTTLIANDFIVYENNDIQDTLFCQNAELITNKKEDKWTSITISFENHSNNIILYNYPNYLD